MFVFRKKKPCDYKTSYGPRIAINLQSLDELLQVSLAQRLETESFNVAVINLQNNHSYLEHLFSYNYQNFFFSKKYRYESTALVLRDQIDIWQW